MSFSFEMEQEDASEFSKLFKKALDKPDLEILKELRNIDPELFSHELEFVFDRDVIFLWENKLATDKNILNNSSSLSPKVLEKLLQNGYNPNQASDLGQTLVHLFSWKHGDEKVDSALVKLLIEYKADVNAQDNFGYTPLHIVENLNIAKILLDAGANPEIKNNDGKSSIDKIREKIRTFASRGNVNMVKRLKAVLRLMEENVIERKRISREAMKDLLIKDLINIVDRY